MKPKFPTALIIFATIVLGVGGLAAWKVYDSVTPGKYDGFAQCLSEKGLKFYGASWCVHCQAQKKVFGKSAKRLPYVECSIPGSNGQADECGAAGVTSYPTWVFPDGSRQDRVLELSELAEKSGCTLP